MHSRCIILIPIWASVACISNLSHCKNIGVRTGYFIKIRNIFYWLAVYIFKGSLPLSGMTDGKILPTPYTWAMLPF